MPGKSISVIKLGQILTQARRAYGGDQVGASIDFIMERVEQDAWFRDDELERVQGIARHVLSLVVNGLPFDGATERLLVSTLVPPDGQEFDMGRDEVLPASKAL